MLIKNIKSVAVVGALILLSACGQQQKKELEMGTYGYDAAFFKKNNVEFIELKSKDGLSKVMVIPAYQGRVMTSSATGDAGDSFGWINYKLIESGKTDPQFNAIGGEERFWLGPEGGRFSLYFEAGEEQVYENWNVPAVIDTESFDVINRNDESVTFSKNTMLKNTAGTVFNMDIKRTVSLMSKEDIANMLDVEISPDLKFLAYKSDNTITNTDTVAWTKEGGVPSIWLLGMFNPTPTTTVFIPYESGAEGKIVNDEYFGKVPTDRLTADNGMLYFKIDGKHRAKIGIPAGRAKSLCGSYDSEKKVLTLVWFNLPGQPASYVNGQWGEQEDAFAGDVINAYNDGPVADGSIMGPFYEIETSSPGAELAPGQSLNHVQCVIHMQGDEAELAKIVSTLFNVSLNTISTKFQ